MNRIEGLELRTGLSPPNEGDRTGEINRDRLMGHRDDGSSDDRGDG